MREINIVGPSAIDRHLNHKLKYECTTMTVYSKQDSHVYWSRSRKEGMPNVFTCIPNKIHENDSFWITEPFIVDRSVYDLSILSNFKSVFGFSDKFTNNKLNNFTVVNYGIDCIDFKIPTADELREKWVPCNKRNGVLIVGSFAPVNDQTVYKSHIAYARTMLADLLHKNGFDVSWYFNPTRAHKELKEKPYYKGGLDDSCFSYKNKIDKMCEFKYNICIENSYDEVYSHNYMSEKLPHAIYGGAIPLYLGCYNIEEFVPSSVYFDLRPFINNTTLLGNELIKCITNINHNEYNEAQYKYISDGLCKHTDLNRVYEKMLDRLT